MICIKPNTELLAREMSSVITLAKTLFTAVNASFWETAACSRNCIRHRKMELALVMSGAFVAAVSRFSEIINSAVELVDCDPGFRVLLFWLVLMDR